MLPIVIIGPTSIGKTETAIEIAKQINAEIISADSMQIYKFMDIGTAKPTKQQQEKIKHHLIDIKMPNEKYSAGEFAKEAKNIIKNLKSERKNALVVGGTGFYIEALVHGIDRMPKVDSKIKSFFDDICDELGTHELFKWLNIVDEKWTRKIHPNDCQRIKRGLSVFIASKKPLSDFFTNTSKSDLQEFHIFVLFSSKNFLKKRIETRSKKMVEKGIVKEAEKLIKMGFGNCDALKSIGYKESLDFINGNIKTLEELTYEISKNTLEYAKRQLTFFKSRFKNATWINIELSDPVKEILEATSTVHSHLS